MGCRDLNEHKHSKTNNHCFWCSAHISSLMELFSQENVILTSGVFKMSTLMYFRAENYTTVA